MQVTNMNKYIIIIVSIAAVAAGVSFNGRQSAPDLSQLSGFSFPEPETLIDVTLVDHNNKPFTEANFKGQWTFLYIGFTFCPDVCPAALTTLNRMHSLLAEEGGAQPSTVLVSVDPDRDTPARLKDYVKYFNESFTGVTGTPAEIAKFAEQVSSVYVVPDNRDDPNYLVDHSSTIILINPNASVQAIFTPPQSAPVLAKDFRLLVADFDSR